MKDHVTIDLDAHLEKRMQAEGIVSKLLSTDVVEALVTLLRL